MLNTTLIQHYATFSQGRGAGAQYNIMPHLVMVGSVFA